MKPLVPFAYLTILSLTSCSDNPASITTYVSENEMHAIDLGEGRSYYGPNTSEEPRTRLKDTVLSRKAFEGNCIDTGLTEIPRNDAVANCRRFQFDRDPNFPTSGSTKRIFATCVSIDEYCPTDQRDGPAVAFIVDKQGIVLQIIVNPLGELRAIYELHDGDPMRIEAADSD